MPIKEQIIAYSLFFGGVFLLLIGLGLYLYYGSKFWVWLLLFLGIAGIIGAIIFFTIYPESFTGNKQ